MDDILYLSVSDAAMKNNSNFVLFALLSMTIWLGFQYFYVRPMEERYQKQQAQIQSLTAATPNAPSATPEATAPIALRDRAMVLGDSPRVPIVTPQFRGSVNLKGGRIDDLTLAQYRETVDPHSGAVTLLSPSGSAPPTNAYYTDISWLAGSTDSPVPNAETQWTTRDTELSPDHPVRLTWTNGKGLTFERKISVDDEFLFTITDHVKNDGSTAVTLYPFGLITRQGDYFIERRNLPASERAHYSPVAYEGPLGVLDGTLDEIAYKKLREDGKKTMDSNGGWLGISDKYWLIALIPPQDESLTASFSAHPAKPMATDADADHFQTDFRGAATVIAPAASVDYTTHLFAGAKHLKSLSRYSDLLHVSLFTRAIDFGWFWFLTIPFLQMLNFLGHTLGSAGLAILVFTVMIRLITAPLTVKMYHSSNRMKELMPEIKRIQERFADDKMRQQQEQAALFKREKINPLAGCLPMLIQLPIFFALYKTLSVSIELRQASFYGWIQDMSAADPTSLFTLFGLIPWNPPIHIGAWPVLMGASMWVQQKLAPQPTDATQARMFMFMPIVLTYIMAQLPVGLVIYYTWSNLFSIGQQWYMMRSVAKKAG